MRRNPRPAARAHQRVFFDNRQIQTRTADPETHRIGSIQTGDDVVAIPGEGAVGAHEQVHIAQTQRQQRRIGQCDAVAVVDGQIRLLGDFKTACRQHKTADAKVQVTADLKVNGVGQIDQLGTAYLADTCPVHLGVIGSRNVIQQIQFPHVKIEADREADDTHPTYMSRQTLPAARTDQRIFFDNGNIQARTADLEAHSTAGVDCVIGNILRCAFIIDAGAHTHEQTQVAQTDRHHGRIGEADPIAVVDGQSGLLAQPEGADAYDKTR